MSKKRTKKEVEVFDDEVEEAFNIDDDEEGTV